MVDSRKGTEGMKYILDDSGEWIEFDGDSNIHQSLRKSR